GQHHVDRQQLADRGVPPHPAQPRGGEHHGVEVRVRAERTVQAGLDVAADPLHIQVRPGPQQLGAAARGAGAHLRPGRQLGEGEAVAGAERVARILPRRVAGQGDLLERSRGEVLAGVDDHVDRPVQQRLAYGGDEHAGAADLGERTDAVAVAVGAHVHQLDGVPGAGHERLAHLPRLGQGEVGGAGADAQGRTGGGHEVAPARTASCSRRWAAICSRVSTSCSADTARAALTWQQLWPQTSSTAPSSVTAIRSREGSRCSCTMSASAATKRGSVPEVATRRKASCCSWAVSFASVSRSQITSTWSVTKPIGTTITASAWSSAATRAMTSLTSGSSQGTCGEPERDWETSSHPGSTGRSSCRCSMT